MFELTFRLPQEAAVDLASVANSCKVECLKFREQLDGTEVGSVWLRFCVIRS